jgi:cyclic pyranopterin phosphate synthase
MNKKLSHLDSQGNAKMVDISEKQVVRRTASAEGRIRLSPGTSQLILEAGLPKGNPFEVARLAGIQAAKQTSRLIPLCHDLNLDIVDVQIELNANELAIRSRVSCRWATGVEMEALTAVSVAALTLYDMCKAVDKEMTIGEIRLVEKTKENPDQ